MHKSDLVEIIGVLYPDEREQLHFYLEKEKNNIKPEVVLLIRFIIQCLNAGESSKLERKSLYSEVFQGQTLVENKLEKHMSWALMVVRKFASELESVKQLTDISRILMLQRFYNDRGLVIKSRAAYNQMLRAKEKPEFWDAEEYYSYFLSEKEESISQSAINHGKGDVNMKNTIAALSEYFFVEHLWLICFVLNQKQIVPFETPPLNELSPIDLKSPKFKWFFEKPLGKLFEKTLSLLQNRGQADVKALKTFVSLLKASENMISNAAVSMFEASACNLGIHMVNMGHQEYLPVVFEIQKDRLRSGRNYSSKGFITASEFQSILTNSLRLNELDWAKTFIESHKKRIVGIMPSQHYYYFAMANYYYKTKDYHEARKILMTSEYEDLQYRYSARILEIKALYEQTTLDGTDYRVTEYLEDRVEAAILFFFRLKGMGTEKKKMAKRFADTLKRIIHAKSNKNKKHLAKIKEDIIKAEVIAERNWLIGIMDNIIWQMDASPK